MKHGLIAGVDCSTQGTKVLILDPNDGDVVASGRASHDVSGRDGARETDPEQWWQALAEALAETGRAGDVAAIAVAGQQHGLVPLDGEGRPVHPAMLWNDTRSAAEAQELITALGGPSAWAERIGVVPVASFTVTKWAWLRRHRPDTAAATRAIRLPHDFLTERLTGNGVTDRGDTSGTGWWSTADESYAATVLDLEAVALDPGMLPVVLGPTDSAGTVTAAAAAHTGVPEGAVVGPGTGDNMGAALGLGLRPGVPVISLGTSGTAYAVSATRVADPTGTVAGFADGAGAFLPLAATLNCTLAVDRVATLLGRDRDEAAERTEAVVLPYFDGERTPDYPNAAATFLGVRHDTTPGELLLATYEGAAASLIEAITAIDEAGSGLDPAAPVVLIGGGARGATWRSVVGRLSGRPLLIPAADELVALGAAVQAAAVVTGAAPAEIAERWKTAAGEELPAPARDDAALDRIRSGRQAAAEVLAGR